MKKIIIIIALIIVILSLNKQEQLIIPKESIRFRIIASSNNSSDQHLKKEIVNKLSKQLENKNITDINQARTIIKNELPTYEKVIQDTINDNNYTNTFSINYGNNYFPKKEYKDIIYPAGEYESLVITLGEGQGDNFWCVLFPPLCLIDEEEEEYPSLIKDVITKYF